MNERMDDMMIPDGARVSIQDSTTCQTCGHSRSFHVEHRDPWCVECASDKRKQAKYPADGCRRFIPLGMQLTVEGQWP